MARQLLAEAGSPVKHDEATLLAMCRQWCDENLEKSRHDNPKLARRAFCCEGPVTQSTPVEKRLDLALAMAKTLPRPMPELAQVLIPISPRMDADWPIDCHPTVEGVFFLRIFVAYPRRQDPSKSPRDSVKKAAAIRVAKGWDNLTSHAAIGDVVRLLVAVGFFERDGRGAVFSQEPNRGSEILLEAVQSVAAFKDNDCQFDDIVRFFEARGDFVCEARRIGSARLWGRHESTKISADYLHERVYEDFTAFIGKGLDSKLRPPA